MELASEFEAVSASIDASGLSVSDWPTALTGSDAAFETFISQLEALGPEAFEGVDGGLVKLVDTLRHHTLSRHDFRTSDLPRR